MIKLFVHHFKILLILILDLIHNCEKFVRFFLSGKHEFERICEAPCDIYEKTFKIDQWLNKTNCEKIRDFIDNQLSIKKDGTKHSAKSVHRVIDKIIANYIDKPEKGMAKKADSVMRQRRSKNNGRDGILEVKIANLEDGDDILSQKLTSLTIELMKLIKKTKHRLHLNVTCEEVLKDVIYRILGYRLCLIVAERIASINYDPNVESHTTMLVSLWNNLVNADSTRVSDDLSQPSKTAISMEYRSKISNKNEIVSGRWSFIGFQGEDPGTDFRGMGLLGLEQLEYISRRPKNLSIDLLRRSLNDQHEYPWAIVGINITYNLLCLFRDGSMKHLFYDDGELIFRNKRLNLNLIKTFNDLYVELFLRFDCFWHESKPENIFAFKELMEKFVDVIKTDLLNRNFTFKFIY